MAKKTPENPEGAKLKRLRAARIADEAERRTNGSWGDFTVGEVVHPATNKLFVLYWRGREPIDIAKRARAKSVLMTPDSHAAFAAWVAEHAIAEFRVTLFAWNLSEIEAKRMMAARIYAYRASGRSIVNPAPLEVAAPA